MGFEFVKTAEARAASGLRMVVVNATPSPWSEAAKGLFHIKGLDWLAVHLDQQDAELSDWCATPAFGMSAPMAWSGDEGPLTSAPDIIALAERLAPDTPLVPEAHRDAVMDIVDRCAGKGGIGHWRRVQQMRAGLAGEGGFHPKIAGYLASKYGYSDEQGAAADDRLADLLTGFSQQVARGGFLVGDSVTAADVYLACFLNLFDPMDDANCPMHPGTRKAFDFTNDQTRAALGSDLIPWRDAFYAAHLELPMRL